MPQADSSVSRHRKRIFFALFFFHTYSRTCTMRYFLLFTGMLSMLAISCTRNEQREARYDPKECTFCSTKPGVCFYCDGSGKCTYCKGTGTRTTISPDMAELNLKKAQYTEKCPFCHGTGKCRYCDGKGKCWACAGTGKIESWDFLEKCQRETAAKNPPVKAEAIPPSPAPADTAAQKK